MVQLSISAAMSTQRLISGLQKELEEAFTEYQITPTPDIKEKEEILYESFEIEFPIATKSSSLFELSKGYCYAHYSIYEQSMHEPAICAGQNLYSAPWIEMTHPDDLAFILKLIKSIILFLNLLPKENCTGFSASFPHRILNRRGDYDCYIHACKVILKDDNGKAFSILMHSTLCTLPLAKNKNRYRLIHIEPAGLFRKSNFLNKKEYFMFTNVEKAVVKKITEEEICKNAAKGMYISDKTIIKHNRHICSKTSVKYIRQACFYASQLGLFQLVPILYSLCTDDGLLLT